MANPKLIYPFASSGNANEIPLSPQQGMADNRATYQTGFPQVTFLSQASGGKAPLGADFNGIFKEITSLLFYMQQGLLFHHDNNMMNVANGYQAGALIRGEGGEIFYSKKNGNKSPTSDADAWANLANLDTSYTKSQSDARYFSREQFDARVDNDDGYVRMYNIMIQWRKITGISQNFSGVHNFHTAFGKRALAIFNSQPIDSGTLVGNGFVVRSRIVNNSSFELVTDKWTDNIGYNRPAHLFVFAIGLAY